MTNTLRDSAAAHNAAPKNIGGLGSATAMVHCLHTIAGIFVAPLLLIAALSGFFYALAPSLENVVYQRELSATSGLPAHPLAAQIEAAQSARPDLTFSSVQVSDDSTATTRVLFDDPTLPSSSYRQTVFVDPGSLEVTGELVQYGSSRALPLRSWISEGHRRLWLGEPGRIYSEMAASWLGILALAGAWMWWTQRRKKSGSSARARAKKWHSTVGIWLLPGFLFLTISGLTWSMVAGTNIGELRTQLGWVTPKPEVAISTAMPEMADMASMAGMSAHHHMEAMSWSGADISQADTVYSTAREAGLTGVLELTGPADANSAWVASEMRQAWKMENDAVSINGATGVIVDTVNFADWPLAAQLTAWIIQLHMGTLFGLLNQIVMALIALGLFAIICWGYLMWWRRGKAGKPGRLPAAGQWRKASPFALAAVGIFTLAYAIMAPLFGISLIVFVVLDAIIQRVRSRS